MHTQLLMVTAATLLLLFASAHIFPTGRFGQVLEIDTNALHRTQETKELESQLLIDLNKADLDQLQRIAGVGPALAQAILDYRTQHGDFASLEGLLDVKGIGQAKLEQMRPYCSVG